MTVAAAAYLLVTAVATAVVANASSGSYYSFASVATETDASNSLSGGSQSAS